MVKTGFGRTPFTCLKAFPPACRGLCAILSSVKPRTRDGVDLGAACVYLGRLLCLLPREVRGRAEKRFLAPHRLVCGLQDVRRQQVLRERAEEAEANKKAEVTTMS